MKWYGHAPNASMSMHDDPELNRLLGYLFRGFLVRGACEGSYLEIGQVSVVIETGTYLGTGSTRFIADAFQQARGENPGLLHTIECNFTHYVQAKDNLARYPFVKPYWGSSVSAAEARDFLANDEALAHPERYPDIWIDHMADAATHYANEVVGAPDPQRIGARPEKWMGEHLLADLLMHHLYDKPLVVLDSAGGIGLLEFQTMRRIMGKERYYVLLDDVEHVKHFRSLQFMERNSDFRILGRGQKWALAVHLDDRL